MEKATIIGIDLAKRVFQVHAAALSRQIGIDWSLSLENAAQKICHEPSTE